MRMSSPATVVVGLRYLSYLNVKPSLPSFHTRHLRVAVREVLTRIPRLSIIWLPYLLAWIRSQFVSSCIVEHESRETGLVTSVATVTRIDNYRTLPYRRIEKIQSLIVSEHQLHSRRKSGQSLLDTRSSRSGIQQEQLWGPGTKGE